MKTTKDARRAKNTVASNWKPQILQRRARKHPSLFRYVGGEWWVVYEDITRPAHCHGATADLPDYAKTEWRTLMSRRSANARDKAVRAEVIQETGGHCIYCDGHASKVDLTIEHLRPLSRGGARRGYVNMAPACNLCNQRRGNSFVALARIHPAWRGYVEWKFGGCKPTRGIERGKIRKWA